MTLEAARTLVANARAWNAFDVDPRVAAQIRDIPDEVERELVAMLGPAADQVPLEGRLSSMPNFMPRGNIYNRTDCEPFQEPGWLLALRCSAPALPVFRELFATHASREVRLAAGHFLLHYPGTAAEVAEASVAHAALPGWFRLWVGAQIALSPAEAYAAVVDRIATTTDSPKDLLHAAMDAARAAALTDPRWGDLAMMALEHAIWNQLPFAVLANVRDRRVVPHLMTEVENPDHTNRNLALDRLVKVVGADEAFELLQPRIAKNPRSFEAFFARHGIAAGMRIVEDHKEQAAAALAARRLPFLFFGAAPADWFEGANDGHLYILCFEGSLDAAAKRRVGHAIAPLDAECELSATSWRWAELDGCTWAYFYCGGDPFEVMRDDLLPAIHRVVKLREVIFGGSREELEDDDWTKWSLLQDRAAPRVPLLDGIDAGMIFYFHGREAVPVRGTVDRGFEEARRAK